MGGAQRTKRQMRVVLTGASGFIGRATLRALVARGHDVCALVRSDALAPGPNIKRVVGTLATVPWPEIQAFEPDCCVLGAWIATPGEYLSSPLNDEFQRWTVEFARQARSIGVKHFTGLGSCIEYQIDPNSQTPLSELRTPLAGRDSPAYVTAKTLTRKLLREENAGQVCWARIFQPYGRDEHPLRLCITGASALAQQKTAFVSSPDSVRDFTHVDDIARALVCLVETRAVGDYNVGTGVATSIREIAELIAELSGSPATAVVENVPGRPDPYPYVVADSTRLRSLGWQPILTLRQGLASLVAGLRR